MKMVKVLLVIAMVACTFTLGCSRGFDLNNPSADEYDVQIIGDSVFDFDGDIRNILKTLSGKGYKDRSMSGALIAGVESQASQALGTSTLKTVIADGGGNDAQAGSADCDGFPLSQTCLNTLNYVADTMENIMDDLYLGGVDDCIWLGYYNMPRTKAVLNDALDHAYTLYPAVYASTPMPVHLVDPRPYIGPEHILSSDDLHPTYAGSEIIANLIWDEMVAQDVYR